LPWVYFNCNEFINYVGLFNFMLDFNLCIGLKILINLSSCLIILSPWVCLVSPIVRGLRFHVMFYFFAYKKTCNISKREEWKCNRLWLIERHNFLRCSFMNMWFYQTMLVTIKPWLISHLLIYILEEMSISFFYNFGSWLSLSTSGNDRPRDSGA